QDRSVAGAHLSPTGGTEALCQQLVPALHGLGEQEAEIVSIHTLVLYQTICWLRFIGTPSQGDDRLSNHAPLKVGYPGAPVVGCRAMTTLAFNRPVLTPRPLKPALLELDGISRESVEAHYKLYEGYVNKRNEIMERLGEIELGAANQVYSDV